MRGEKIGADNRYEDVGLNAEISEARSAGELRSQGRVALVNALKSSSANDVEMDDFSDVYPASKIASDKRYIERAESGMEAKNELAQAQVFENLFVNGVMLGNWLGGIVVEDGKRMDKFDVETHNTTRYDDILNKIDTFATLRFDEPIEDEDYGTSINEVALGFDVTVNGYKRALLDKITRFSNNGNKDLPFGFSTLDYYKDRNGHGQLTMLPRYTIGISGYDVDSIMELSHVREKDGMMDFKLFSAQNLINRFKVLSEIRAENELYQAMLPDDLDEELAQQANIELYAVDQCLHGALNVCTNELVNRKCLPPQVLAEVEEARAHGRGTKARNIVQEYLLERSQEIFDSESNEMAAYGKEQQGDGDTFVEIIKLCEELKEAAYDGKLDQYRQIMPRNKSIPASALE